MKKLSNWLAAAMLGSAFVVAGCADMKQPLAPSDTVEGQTLSRPAPMPSPMQPSEELYLIDNQCGNLSPSGECLFQNGSIIFSVQLNGTAELTELFRLQGQCAFGSTANCSLLFDQAHIGATPDGRRIYVINRRQIGGGNPFGYFDVPTGRFFYEGLVTGIFSPDGVVLAGFGPNGGLWVGNQDDDRIYNINIVTREATNLGRVRKPDNTPLNLVGADLAFDELGRLWIWSNGAAANPGPDIGLWRVDVPFSIPLEAVRIGGPNERFFTGLAFRAAGTGNPVMSGATGNRAVELDRATGALVRQWQFTFNGQPFDHRFGDMATGRLAVPEELWLIDNQCGNLSPSGECLFQNGSILYTIALNGDAQLGQVIQLQGQCAANAPIDCNTHFDQAHIGTRPDNQRVYVINRRRVGDGYPIGYYEVATDRFIYEGLVTGIIAPDGLVLAGFGPDGYIYVGNQNDNRIYRIRLDTRVASSLGMIRRPDGQPLNLVGADLSFDADARLWVWSNGAAANPGPDRGLWHVVSMGGQLQGTRVPNTETIPRFMTGLAFRDAGRGNPVVSNQQDDNVYEVDRLTGAIVRTFRMRIGAVDFDHRFGDMSTGRMALQPFGAQGCSRPWYGTVASGC
jgi:DNA-binding beta-propeller fold protein YncE